MMIAGYRMIHLCNNSMISVKDPIPVDKFGEHVQYMHSDRDKWFEVEYDVSE